MLICVCVVLLNVLFWSVLVVHLRESSRLRELADRRFAEGVRQGLLIGRHPIELRRYYPEAWRVADEYDAECVWESVLSQCGHEKRRKLT